MLNSNALEAARQRSIDLSSGGVPNRTQNQFFGVGPITDMTTDEVDARRLRKEFNKWLEETYPKLDDQGNRIGSFTMAELGRGMHRGYPADKVLADPVRDLLHDEGAPAVRDFKYYIEFGLKANCLDLEKEYLLRFYRELENPGFELHDLRITQRVYVLGDLPPERLVKDLINPVIHTWTVCHDA